MQIGKEEVDGKLRTVGTLNINIDGKEEVVKVRKLTFGEDLTIRNKHTKVGVQNGQPTVDVDQAGLTLSSLKTSIVEAPFEITVQGISDLEKEVATENLQAYNELNNPSEKKK